jgi:hypothetical protein
VSSSKLSNRKFDFIGRGVIFCLVSIWFAFSAHAQCLFGISATAGTPVATKDGLIFVRNALRLTDDAVTANTGSTRTAVEISAAIASQGLKLDLNGSGQFDLVDATIITNYLAGFRGDSLIPNGAGAGATRMTGAAIQDFIDNGCRASATSAPGGFYIGYYLEDPVNNPEDPLPGSIYFRLPAGNSDFSGEMFFTYFGCESRDTGTISGTKSQLSLTGTWAGTVYGSAQDGGYTGQFNSTLGFYQGTYSNSRGKQAVNTTCATGYIAGLGSWELFPVGNTFSSDTAATAVRVQNNTLSWYVPSGSAASLISILDQTAAQSGSNAFVGQSFLAGSSVSLLPNLLVSGRTYVISALGLSTNLARTYFSSVLYTAP